MIRILACIFGLRWAMLGGGDEAARALSTDQQTRSGPLDEYFSCFSHTEVTPEVLLRIL